MVILESHMKTPQMGLYALSMALSQRGVAKKIQVIAKARVPIIKFVEKRSGISIDEKQKRRRKKVVIESSEETVSDSNDKKSSRAIVLHTSEQQVNSDDDFVDPQPRVNPTKNEKKEKAESKPKRSLRKDKTKEQPEQQPYYDYDGKKINIRCAVNNLKDYIEGLSKEQRNAVREIGFESILKFNLHSVPRKFGYWLVKNFDAENDEINTGDEKIKITAEFIQKVFQIPNGKTEIEEKLRPKDTDLIIKFWRGQFSKDILKRMYAHNLISYLKSRNELGRLFKLNFLVIFFTIMAEAMQSSNVNQRFLPSMKSDKKNPGF
ncbi:putative Nucleotidyltransferase superfamily [Helianthus annuus]|nr:putative Nucleotidyltransferase superfamily [Helianthus annuus]